MISTLQLRNTYLESQLDSCVNPSWAELSANELWLRIEELVKVLYVAPHALFKLPISTEMSDLWHFWTRQKHSFQKLCDLLNLSKTQDRIQDGTQHELRGYNAEDKQNARDAVGLLAEYKTTFGNFSIDRLQYWPLAKMVMKRYAFDMDELNDWLDNYCHIKQQENNPWGRK